MILNNMARYMKGQLGPILNILNNNIEYFKFSIVVGNNIAYMTIETLSLLECGFNKMKKN